MGLLEKIIGTDSFDNIIILHSFLMYSFILEILGLPQWRES